MLKVQTTVIIENNYGDYVELNIEELKQLKEEIDKFFENQFDLTDKLNNVMDELKNLNIEIPKPKSALSD